MANLIICKYNKFGYCKFGEKCRKQHIKEICFEKSCEISQCNQRHPKVCRYYRNYGRCKFSPCAFKHEDHANYNETVDKEIKTLHEKFLALEKAILGKNEEIEELTNKILSIEHTLFENFNKIIEEKLEAFEKKLFEKIEGKLKTFSDFMGEAAGSIDDLVVELNDDMGNISIESEGNALLRTFDNPFQFKCNFCDFQAKSERGLKSHKTRKHENCDWCEFICDSNSEMKKHKMDKHTIAYSKEVLQGFIGKSP